MAVPAHDQRDYDFAKEFGIDIIEVIKGGDITKEAYTGDGEMVNSEFLNGYTNKKESIARMLEDMQAAPRQSGDAMPPAPEAIPAAGTSMAGQGADDTEQPLETHLQRPRSPLAPEARHVVQ